jgi:hypothetical protein
MVWYKLGLLLVGFIFAGILPYSVQKAVKQIDIDLKKQTLSFISNKSLFGKEYKKRYTQLMFVSAILLYAFFWLLTQCYDLGEHETYLRYIDYSFAVLALLAFVPHNMNKYSLRTLGPSLQRLGHNLLGLVVFLSIPILVITFQLAIIDYLPFIGIAGLVIIVTTVLLTTYSVLSSGLNGISELIFINGVSIWILFVTVYTVLF